MSISLVELDSASTVLAATTGHTLDFSGATENNLMLAQIAHRANATVTASPSGWSLVGESLNNPKHAAGERVYVYSKIAGSSETTYTWTYGSKSVPAVAVAYEVIGSGNTVEATDKYGGTDGTDANISVGAGEAAILFASKGLSSATPANGTPPSGFTEVTDIQVAQIATSSAIRNYASSTTTGDINYTERATGVLISVSAGTPGGGTNVAIIWYALQK